MKVELVRVAGQAQKMGALPDQVERDIRQAKVDFQRRGMATPFRETLAQDQRIVAQPLAIIDNGRVMMSLGWRVEGAMIACALRFLFHVFFNGRKAGHQMCFTSSGMS